MPISVRSKTVFGSAATAACLEHLRQMPIELPAAGLWLRLYLVVRQ
jgi:hypothetical protein